MATTFSRRALLALTGTAAAGVAVSSGAVAIADEASVPAVKPKPGNPQEAGRLVSGVYQRESVRAGGTWNSFVTVTNPDGTLLPAVEDKPDDVVEALSVNKIAVAVTVFDKVDRGQLQLTQTVDVTQEIVAAEGDGIFRLDRAFPSKVTLGHVLAALLTVSDDTAVRLCGLVVPAAEVNQILVAKGFLKTQVTPVENPNRFFLGKTTPRETHDLLQKLVQGKLLSPTSTEHLLAVLRSPIAFTDGIRRTMSSAERLRIATKAGFFTDGRHEAGIIFDVAGKPVLTYALFARGQAGADDFGATHPAVQARSVMGREFLDAVNTITGPASWHTYKTPMYRSTNGG